MGNSLGLAGQSECLWKSEGDLVPGLGLLSSVGALLHGFSNCLSLFKRTNQYSENKQTLHLPVSSFIYS